MDEGDEGDTAPAAHRAAGHGSRDGTPIERWCTKPWSTSEHTTWSTLHLILDNKRITS